MGVGWNLSRGNEVDDDDVGQLEGKKGHKYLLLEYVKIRSMFLTRFFTVLMKLTTFQC